MTIYVWSCSIFAITAYAILILQFLPGAAFSALRAFVLSESKPLGILVFALSLAPVGANLATYGYQYSGEHSQPFGCFGVDDTTVALELRFVTIISRVPIILSDILLIYITWTKLSTRGALMGIRWSKRLSLSDILFRGGDIYFIILSILNVLHLVLTSLALADASVTGESEVPTFTVPITGILISRFLLELQETNQMVVRVDPEDPLHSSRNPYDSTPSFIVSLGGLVHSDQPARSDDEGVKLQVHSRARSEVAEEEQGGSQAESLQASASSSCSA
ncbi:hypothetical protein K466DRAFT_150486 [Polyporus arcularius HHB13444]|uniref:Uncharacterized protein n=1 Tax=Polyporus arcularius HHB13444 TaxID=1314778 RepID=A0A5C3PC02_9APHY|nr:hypothetical protein K466DRAFT_150486 [Polyporus arcularius HHB13444]